MLVGAVALASEPPRGPVGPHPFDSYSAWNQYQPEIPCRWLMMELPTIPLSRRETKDFELEEAGEIYRYGQKIPHHAMGKYVYLGTKHLEIIVAKKFDPRAFLATGKGLATHKSMENYYFRRTGRHLADVVVFAGEDQEAFDEVGADSNRSGNWSGDLNSYWLGRQIRKEFGWVFTKETATTILDPKDKNNPKKKYKFGHVELTDRAELMKYVTFYQMPHGEELMELFDELGTLLVNIWREQESRVQAGQDESRQKYLELGQVVTDQVLEMPDAMRTSPILEATNFVQWIARLHKRSEAPFEFLYPFSHAHRWDGVILPIRNTWRNISEKKIDTPYYDTLIPYYIEPLIDYTEAEGLAFAKRRARGGEPGPAPMVTKEQRDQLRRIVADFRRLGPAPQLTPEIIEQMRIEAELAEEQRKREEQEAAEEKAEKEAEAAAKAAEAAARGESATETP